MAIGEVVPFDTASVDPACVAVFDSIAPGVFEAAMLSAIVEHVGPDDTELAEQLLQGLAVRMQERPQMVPSVVSPIEAAEGAARFGVMMRYTTPEDQRRFWKPWGDAFERIAARVTKVA